MFYDRGNHYEFRTMQQELAVPGELRSNTSFDFEFRNVEKQYESYHGINVKLRYATAESLRMDGHIYPFASILMVKKRAVSGL